MQNRGLWSTPVVAMVLLLALMQLTPGRAQTASEPPASAVSVLMRDAEAATLLESHLRQQPTDADVLTALAEVRIALGDTAAAEALLWRALSSRPDLSRANLMLGHLLLTQHKEPEAMDRFETVLAKDRRNPEARRGENDAVTGLAIRMRREQRPELALKALEHARQALPDDPKLLLELGIQATELGMTREALDALHAARTLNPDNAEILYALARAEMNAQQMPEAEADLRAYLIKRPDDASAHFGLGRVLEGLLRNAEARAEFTRSLALQPAQTESNYELGQMALEVGEFDQAETQFAKTLSRDAKHGGALTGMGILAYRRKRYEQAEEWLVQAVEAAPNYPPAHYYRGLSLARLGRKQESDRELKAATELDHREQAPPAVHPEGTAGAIEPSHLP